jgi:hypothetical protein
MLQSVKNEAKTYMLKVVEVLKWWSIAIDLRQIRMGVYSKKRL